MRKIYLIFLCALTAVGCTTTQQSSSPYFLVTGKPFKCDEIFRNICIEGFSNESDLINKTIDSFNNSSFEKLQIFKLKKENGGNIKLISGSFNYNFSKKIGSGIEETYNITIDSAGKYNIKRESQILIDP